MSKKRTVVINYAGRRVLLETIASYWPCITRADREEPKYGIEYLLRSGEKVDASGDDKPSRDKAIVFLDSYFKPDAFTGNKCDVCAIKDKDCNSKYGCRPYNGYQGFERAEEVEGA